jgi:hypothetical protein
MKIIIVPLKHEFTRKLVLLHGLKGWVQNIVYQRENILNTCQALMKLAEYMEDDGLLCHHGEFKSMVTQKNNVGPNNGNKGQNKWKWDQSKLRSPDKKEKPLGKKLMGKKDKCDLTKVMCFNYEKLGHLVNEVASNKCLCFPK